MSLLRSGCRRELGAASAYPTALRDSEGDLFVGKKLHRLRVPADTPARDFWSVVAYSMKTKSMIPNPQNRVGLSSYDKSELQMNADSSAKSIRARRAARKGGNWLPTAARISS